MFAADLDGDGRDEVMSQDPQGCYLAGIPVDQRIGDCHHENPEGVLIRRLRR